MKKLSLLLIVGCCIGATISCKKEVSTKEVSANAESQSMSAVSEDEATRGGSATKFGAAIVNISSVDQKIAVLNKLGAKYVRTAVILKHFNGNAPDIDKYYSNGIKVLLNINYNNGGSAFPTNMNDYNNRLESVLKKYANKIEVAVIENEPTTDLFHTGPIQNYITELKNAVTLCHKYGVKVTDGATHIDNIKSVMKGNLGANHNTRDVATLINAYRTINLDYVNVHTAAKGGTNYPQSDFTSVADYVRSKTGHPVMSNEFHIENQSSSLMKSMITGWKAGNYQYALYFSGDYPLSKGTNLTTIGTAFKDATN